MQAGRVCSSAPGPKVCSGRSRTAFDIDPDRRERVWVDLGAPPPHSQHVSVCSITSHVRANCLGRAWRLRKTGELRRQGAHPPPPPAPGIALVANCDIRVIRKARPAFVLARAAQAARA